MISTGERSGDCDTDGDVGRSDRAAIRPISTRSGRGSTGRSTASWPAFARRWPAVAPGRVAPDRRGDPADRGGRQAAPAGVLLLGLPSGGRRRRRAHRACRRRARAAPHDGVDPRRPHGSEPRTARGPLQRDPAGRAARAARVVGPRARGRVPRAAGRRSRRGPRRSPPVGRRGSSPDRLIGALDRYHRMRIGHGARAEPGRRRRRPRSGAAAAALKGGSYTVEGPLLDRRRAGRRRTATSRRRSRRTERRSDWRSSSSTTSATAT